MDNHPPMLIDQNNKKVYLVVGEDENETVKEGLNKLKEAGFDIVFIDSNEELHNIVEGAKVGKTEAVNGKRIGVIGHCDIGLKTIEMVHAVADSQIPFVSHGRNDYAKIGNEELAVPNLPYILNPLPELSERTFFDENEVGRNSGGIKLTKVVNAKKFKRKKKGKKTHRKKRK